MSSPRGKPIEVGMHASSSATRLKIAKLLFGSLPSASAKDDNRGRFLGGPLTAAASDVRAGPRTDLLRIPPRPIGKAYGMPLAALHGVALSVGDRTASALLSYQANQRRSHPPPLASTDTQSFSGSVVSFGRLARRLSPTHNVEGGGYIHFLVSCQSKKMRLWYPDSMKNRKDGSA